MFNRILSNTVQDFQNLIFPSTCFSCQKIKVENSNIFCISCQHNISITDHFVTSINSFTLRVDNRIPYEFGAAYFHYIKEGKIQKILHALKYNGRKDIGIKVGKLFGIKYSDSVKILPDAILAIPLHKRRQNKRGYNQSEMFAQGISSVTGIPLCLDVLIKKGNNDSLTQKNRTDRFTSVLNQFDITKHSQKLKGKTVLLVDDVLTTGATLEAACTLLQSIDNIVIHLGTIAIAQH